MPPKKRGSKKSSKHSKKKAKLKKEETGEDGESAEEPSPASEEAAESVKEAPPEPSSDQPWPSGGGERIWNPCPCSRGTCNLRLFVLAIGIYFIMIAFVNAVGYKFFNPRFAYETIKDCDDYVVEDDEVKECLMAFKFKYAQLGLLLLNTSLCFLIGFFILLAVALRMRGISKTVFGAVILMVTNVVFLLLRWILFIYIIRTMTSSLDPVFYQEKDSTEIDNSRITMWTVIAVVFLLIEMPLEIYFIICVYQFYLQRKAGVDRHPA